MTTRRHRKAGKDNGDEPPITEQTAEPTHDARVSETEGEQDAETAAGPGRIAWPRVLVYGVAPGLVLVLALVAGLLKGLDSSVRYANVARIESVRAAKDAAIAMLSYQSETVDHDLGAAQDRLIGDFGDSYSRLTHDVIIPGAKEKHISAQADVASASAVSATANHAVVLLFVDQLVAVGDATPTKTRSSVRVTLDKIDGRWLVSAFDPV
jgi:Mce-associated membrane protein